ILRTVFLCFFFQAEDGIRDFHVTGVQTCALPISPPAGRAPSAARRSPPGQGNRRPPAARAAASDRPCSPPADAATGSRRESVPADRKSTRLNSSHVKISYAVFCLKKKKQNHSVH